MDPAPRSIVSFPKVLLSQWCSSSRESWDMFSRSRKRVKKRLQTLGTNKNSEQRKWFDPSLWCLLSSSMFVFEYYQVLEGLIPKTQVSSHTHTHDHRKLRGFWTAARFVPTKTELAGSSYIVNLSNWWSTCFMGTGKSCNNPETKQKTVGPLVTVSHWSLLNYTHFSIQHVFQDGIQSFV